MPRSGPTRSNAVHVHSFVDRVIAASPTSRCGVLQGAALSHDPPARWATREGDPQSNKSRPIRQMILTMGPAGSPIFDSVLLWRHEDGPFSMLHELCDVQDGSFQTSGAPLGPLAAQGLTSEVRTPGRAVRRAAGDWPSGATSDPLRSDVHGSAITASGTPGPSRPGVAPPTHSYPHPTSPRPREVTHGPDARPLGIC